MGIATRYGSHQLFVKGISALLQRPGSRMAELGNQIVWIRPRTPSRVACQMLGIPYTSFDQNGRDGAVCVDLRKVLDQHYHRQYFVVTNFGTSEHVTHSQGIVFQNMHLLCEAGGMLLHSVPQAGSNKGHGDWKYTAGFFESLAAANDYSIDEMWPLNTGGGNIYLNAAMTKKIDSEFNLQDFVWPTQE